jgi:hypothetical protein
MANTFKEIPEFALRYLNITALVGIVVFLLTSVGYYFVVSSTTRSSFTLIDRDLRSVTGTVLSESDTPFGKEGEAPGDPVVRVMFTYRVGNVSYTNAGYSASGNVKPGDELEVHYKESNPEISKATALRASPFGVYGLLAIIFPMAGLLLFLRGVRWGNKFVSILKNGSITEGKLLSVVGSSERYRHYYSFEDENGIKRRVAHDTEERVANEKISILYDRHNPEKAEVVHWRNLPVLFRRRKIRRVLESINNKQILR